MKRILWITLSMAVLLTLCCGAGAGGAVERGGDGGESLEDHFSC